MPRYDKGAAILGKIVRYCEEIYVLTNRDTHPFIGRMDKGSFLLIPTYIQ